MADTQKLIVENIQQMQALKGLVEAYQEIAASRMQKVRNSVLQTRNFLSGIGNIFHHVQASYKNDLQHIMKRKKITDPKLLTFLEKSDKKACVFISANTGLYGDLPKKTFSLFEEEIKNPCEIIIIGKLGLRLFESTRGKTTPTYFDFPDNGIDFDALKKIATYLITFGEVVVFYGEFQSVVSQKAVATNIASSNLLPQEQSGVHMRYMFEPSLPDIMGFFEQEIFTSLFQQTIHESQLAKFASRMVMLEGAIDNIQTNLETLELDKRRSHHRRTNKKQLTIYSSMRFWGGRA